MYKAHEIVMIKAQAQTHITTTNKDSAAISTIALTIRINNYTYHKGTIFAGLFASSLGLVLLFGANVDPSEV
jgi:uncharacterized protein (DUF2141 family)